MNPNYPIVHLHVHSEAHLYKSLNSLRRYYGENVKVIFKPLRFSDEKELIFSRAVARFQHLIDL